MTFRQIVKACLPPVLAAWFRPGPGGGSTTQNWRGIYTRFGDVPVVDPLFGESVINHMARDTEATLALGRAGKKPYLWHEALGMVAGIVCARQDHLRVVDFGGGLGTGYLQLTTCLPGAVRLDYEIVDAEKMCVRGRELFRELGAIRFSTALPGPDASSPDIVYANSVLQYIEDYRAQLRALAGLGAPYLLLARLAAGDGPTFAAEQINMPGHVLPHWFINAGEVSSILAEAGYRLICDELTARVYDHSVFPESHRVERFRDMLFVREDRSYIAARKK